MTGLWVLLAVLVVATAFGLWWRAHDGRVRTTAELLPEPIRLLADQAAAVTLVQLSTTFCAPCRHTRVLLADLAEQTDGLAHVELDITDRPELAAAVNVLRTPTTLAVDRAGRELLRVAGLPRREELAEALRPRLAGSSH